MQLLSSLREKSSDKGELVKSKSLKEKSKSVSPAPPLPPPPTSAISLPEIPLTALSLPEIPSAIPSLPKLPSDLIKMDRKAVVTKAGNFWDSCKKCSKDCLCYCGLKDPKRVAIVSVAILGFGIFIYRGWYKDLPSLAKAVVQAPVRAVRGGKH